MFGLKESEKETILSEVLPLLRIEKDLILLKDGRVAVGYEIIGSPFESMNAGDYDSFCQSFETSLLTLPEHYIVQKIDNYYNAKAVGKTENEESTYFKNETIKYFSENPVLSQRSYVFIISNTNKNIKHNSLSTYFASKNSFLTSSNLKGIDQRMEEVKKNSSIFMDSLLSSSTIKATKLNSTELRNLYYQMLNLEFNEVNEPYKSILNHENTLVIGEKKANVISLYEQGSDLFYSVPNHYGVDSPYTWSLGLYLQCPHLTVTSWYIDNTQDVLKSLDLKKRLNSTLTKVAAQEASAKLLELEEFTMEVRQSQSKFVSVALQVVIYAGGESVRQRNIQTACDAIRNLYGAKPLVETLDNANLYFSMLPGASAGNLRWILMRSAEASSYANFTHEYISRGNGDYIADRFRNLTFVNLFDRNLNNQNSILIGPSGSGKSFTMGHFLLQRYERKERQIIIDVGGTYKNLIEAVGGKYFEYNPENPISFNPFLCSKDANGNYIPSDDKIAFIIAIVQLLWKEKDSSISNIEWSIFQDIIPRFYTDFNKNKKGGIPKLKSFSEWLVTFSKQIQEDPSLKIKFERFDLTALQITLEPFTTGKYQPLLNSNEVLDISDYRFVCFDMAKLKDDTRLYPIVALLLTELSLDTVRKFPNEIKYFVMDEAWSMLSETMGDYVEYMYRTLRKNNGSMTIITQGIEEIINSKVGAAIINNAETKIILNHTDKTQLEKLGKHLGFTSDELTKINSIRVNRDCREFFIKQGNASNVFVLDVPSSEHAVLTSNPIERNHLNMLKKIYNGNIEFAVNQWVEDKNNGKF